ncbi:hypothetical protein F5Y03DRAFT_406298 [Xylaria venustula]|nr:hypothetical protein F5Y03DRAFT_406298 [Xylaria venustula]
MAERPVLPYDILLNMAPCLSVKALLNLAITTSALNEPLTKAAFKAALTVPFDQDIKPMTYAIKQGDILLISQTLAVLDSLHPQGWKWSTFYAKGVGRVLALAAAHSLDSLQFLVEKYPLRPTMTAETVPTSVLDHGFYSVDTIRYVEALVDTRNSELVQIAIQQNQFECAAFLLTQYQPPLFPDGFALRGNPVFYSSATALEFLIDHGARLEVDSLQNAIVTGNSVHPQVFDVLVEKGFNIDSPCRHLAHLSMGLATTPLNIACGRLQPVSVESLLRLGANPNGISGSSSISKSPFLGGFRYFSPNPMLMLLLSTRWDLTPSQDHRILGQDFIQCFQSFLRYGSMILILDDVFLGIFLFKVWKVVCTRILKKSSIPDCSGYPNDLNQGVRSLLSAISDANITPWGEACQIVSDGNPIWRGKAKQTKGKERLVQFLRDYQDEYGDLPGPEKLARPFLCTLPERYMSN